MLLVVMLFILVTTLATSQLVVSHATQSQREREEELLFVGEQYRKAIASYRSLVPPGSSPALPRSLEDLVSDERFPRPVHHLRRLYPDPITGKHDWDLVRQGDRIIGVRSSSTRTPLKVANFPSSLQHFEGQATYAQWVFAVR